MGVLDDALAGHAPGPHLFVVGAFAGTGVAVHVVLGNFLLSLIIGWFVWRHISRVERAYKRLVLKKRWDVFEVGI